MSYDSQTATSLINKLRKDVDNLTLKTAVLIDQKALGTAGGAAVATTWTTRDLNTVLTDASGLIIDVSSNTFKLAAGAYMVKVIAPFHSTTETRLRLWDVTNDVAIGYSVSAYVFNQTNVYVYMVARIDPHKDNVYRVDYYCNTYKADGLGLATNIDGYEVYTTVEVTRIDTGMTKASGAGGVQGPQGPPGPAGPQGPAGPSGGGVSSVNVSGGSTGLTASGGPITSSGTITLGGTLNVASGGTGQSSYTNGQLLIGNGIGGGLDKATLTAGTNVTITNGPGSITISASGGGGSGNVTGPTSVNFNELARFNGVLATDIEGAGWGTESDDFYCINSGAASMTQGFIWIPKGSGAPGTPGAPTLTSGRAPLYFDSSTNKLFCYNGTAWKSVILT